MVIIDLRTSEVHDMAADKADVVFFSSVTADRSPAVLSRTEMLRFKFNPTLVDNGKEIHKPVSGKLL